MNIQARARLPRATNHHLPYLDLPPLNHDHQGGRHSPFLSFVSSELFMKSSSQPRQPARPSPPVGSFVDFGSPRPPRPNLDQQSFGNPTRPNLEQPSFGNPLRPKPAPQRPQRPPVSAGSPDLDNFIPDFNPQQELEAFMETIGNDNFQVRSSQPPYLCQRSECLTLILTTGLWQLWWKDQRWRRISSEPEPAVTTAWWKVE